MMDSAVGRVAQSWQTSADPARIREIVIPHFAQQLFAKNHAALT